MALETPAWLNLSFVEKILRKSEGDNSIQVIDIFVKPATNKGDNYTSDMLRVSIDFSRERNNRKTEKETIIFKLAPVTEGTRKDLILKSRIFEVEMSMLTDTLNKMNKLLEPTKYRISGKGLYVQRDDPILLVIEDLAPLGFRMADRMAGLDLEHCLLALRGLARFHASSVAIIEKEPKQKDMYARGMFNSDQPAEMGEFFGLATKALAAEMATWPEVNRYTDKVNKLVDRIYQIGIKACELCEDEFNVINHGDFWVNNMMFKYDDNDKPVDHIMVDFQLCAYTSPAIDLHYFLSTSPSPHVIENSKAVLLSEYYNTLVSTMKLLNCKTQPPALEELKTILKKRASYGMIASFTVLPLVLCKKDDVRDLDEMMGKDGSYTNLAYKGEQYRRLMAKRIPLYDEWGLLDL